MQTCLIHTCLLHMSIHKYVFSNSRTQRRYRTHRTSFTCELLPPYLFPPPTALLSAHSNIHSCCLFLYPVPMCASSVNITNNKNSISTNVPTMYNALPSKQGAIEYIPVVSLFVTRDDRTSVCRLQ